MLDTLYYLLVFLVAALCVTIVRRVRPDRALPAGLATSGWLVITAILATSGLLAGFPTSVLMLSTTAILAVYFVPLGQRVAATAPLWLLVGLQSFRFPLELLLHEYYHAGTLPVQMTYAGLNFDILTGLAALPLAWALHRGVAGRRWVWAWNVLGSVLLVTVVAIAVLSLPLPIRQFPDEPSTLVIATSLLVWVPTFLVVSAAVGHLMVFRRLRLEGKTRPAAVNA
ncbi:MAG: hypothetical protein WBA12_05960 [Catalinimonas sp.]